MCLAWALFLFVLGVWKRSGQPTPSKILCGCLHRSPTIIMAPLPPHHTPHPASLFAGRPWIYVPRPLSSAVLPEFYFSWCLLFFDPVVKLAFLPQTHPPPLPLTPSLPPHHTAHTQTSTNDAASDEEGANLHASSAGKSRGPRPGAGTWWCCARRPSFLHPLRHDRRLSGCATGRLAQRGPCTTLLRLLSPSPAPATGAGALQSWYSYSRRPRERKRGRGRARGRTRQGCVGKAELAAEF